VTQTGSDNFNGFRLAVETTLESALVQVESAFIAAGLSYGHGVDNAMDEAAWLVLKVCDEPLGMEDYAWGRPLTASEVKAVGEMVERRINSRKPLAYLLGEAWFAGVPFFIDDRALVPRSFMAEWIPQRFEPWINADDVSAVLDLCCGSGCIGIAAAMAFENASVVLSDLSPEALEVARINIDRHGLSDRVSLNQGGLFHGLEEHGVGQKFDLILCNPPYVSDQRMDTLPAEYRMEPELGLRGGIDGLDFIRPLMQQAGRYLSANGTLIVEAGSAFDAVENVWPRLPLTWLGTEHDEMVLFLVSASELSSADSSGLGHW
jgi:ribosomal protein L3 glutamine methyltransferase